MPEWLQTIARVIPTSYLVELLQGIMLRGEGLRDLLGPIAVLLITLGAGAWANSFVFRWESSEPIDRRRLAIAVVGFGLVLVLAAWIGPGFRMALPPGR
jgi:hypothetical protein